MRQISRFDVVIEQSSARVFVVTELKAARQGLRAKLERALGKATWRTLEGDALPGFVHAREQPASPKWSDIVACMVRVEKTLGK